MIAISSNALSVDMQVNAAIAWTFRHSPIKTIGDFNRAFPEWPDRKWSGHWLDTEAMGVDSEYGSWLAEWIEDNTPIFWFEGEPFVLEPGEKHPDADSDEDTDTGLVVEVDDVKLEYEFVKGFVFNDRKHLVGINKVGGGTLGNAYEGTWEVIFVTEGEQMITGTPKTHAQVFDIVRSFLEQASGNND